MPEFFSKTGGRYKLEGPRRSTKTKQNKHKENYHVHYNQIVENKFFLKSLKHPEKKTLFTEEPC